MATRCCWPPESDETERFSIALFKAGELHELEHLRYLLLNLGGRDFLHTQGEGDVLKDVEMGEKRIALKHGVDVALMRWKGSDVLAEKEHVALVGLLKTGDDPQCGGLTAAAWTQERYKLVVIDIQIDMVQYRLPVKRFGNSFQLDDFPSHGILLCNKKTVCRSIQSMKFQSIKIPRLVQSSLIRKEDLLLLTISQVCMLYSTGL